MSIRYFIPDWDDRVDPRYDFMTDVHTPARNPYRDDVYAHELYSSAPYDGILLSLATLEANDAKRKAILLAGSVHQYLRLPKDGNHTVLGDCGAFTYRNKPEPPYKTEDVLHHYHTLGFDYGVSIDHLIFPEVESEKQQRWDITIENANDFWKLHRQSGYKFEPIGVAQGWSPHSYQEAARALIQMGYNYIAVGGLVRSRDEDIIKILQAIREELRPGMQLHVFGVSRPEHATTFASLGVTSFDSASRLRRAWMDGRRNYFLADETFTAIRVPDAKGVAKKSGQELAPIATLERKALDTLRAYATHSVSMQTALDAVIEYAQFLHKPIARTLEDYRLTLQQRPWEKCECSICRAIGVEVIIFRGNNRNRRRGFHNTWQLYQSLRTLNPEAPQLLPLQMEMSI